LELKKSSIPSPAATSAGTVTSWVIALTFDIA